MTKIFFGVEEYIDGVWSPDPATRPTDLPPHQCKKHKRWDSVGWGHQKDLEAYRQAYAAFAVRLKSEFLKLAGPGGDELEIDADPLHTFYNSPQPVDHPLLDEAIKRAGLPTRKDVEEASNWGDE